MGKTWTNAAGEKVTTPLAEKLNPALVHNYEAEKKLIYIQDTTFDAAGEPVIMYVVSSGYAPGPQDPPRLGTSPTGGRARRQWEIKPVTSSTHNYDVGSLYIEADGTWRIIGPTEPGPQHWGTGGEMAMWTSGDEGKTWKKVKQLTAQQPAEPLLRPAADRRPRRFLCLLGRRRRRQVQRVGALLLHEVGRGLSVAAGDEGGGGEAGAAVGARGETGEAETRREGGSNEAPVPPQVTCHLARLVRRERGWG